MITKLMRRLEPYARYNEFREPDSPLRVNQFDTQRKVRLPSDYREWLTNVANGGELLIPGTVFYGIYDPDCSRSQDMVELLTYWNRREIRDTYRIPKGLFVIGVTNYGSLIGFDEKTGRIQEWDHETGQIAEEWDTFAEYVEEEIEIFEENSAAMDGEDRT